MKMKRTITLLLMILLFLGCKQEVKKSTVKDETVHDEVENESEWVNLFDGKTFKGWHNYMTDSISDEWQIENGTMIFTPHPDRNHGMNNIITDKKYTNFILSIEWKISEEGNSGIFWGIFENEKFPVPYQTAPEIQVLDNLNHPDGAKKTHRAGAIFGIAGPENDLVKKLGEWNHFIIEIDHKNNNGSVVLNGTEIVKFPVHGKEWDKLVANSKFKDWEGFGRYQTGHIGLQDHGNKVWFRNIKIQELD
jgi:hypothetical protein